MNNGRRYTKKIKERARVLRRNGLTHREIAQKLGTSWSIVFLWTKNIILTAEQKKSIQTRRYKPTFTKERRKRLSDLAKIHLAQYWKKPFSKRKLLNKIREFYLKYERIPLKREFNLYETYQRNFGSWNNAIKLAGFEPNQVVFSKKFIAKDGHVCDSYAEKIIDDWLSKYRISHKKNLLYQNTRMTADFSVKNIRIEYFGLFGENKLYDETIFRKRKFCQEKNLKLVEIYPADLFPNRLSKLINLKELK